MEDVIDLDVFMPQPAIVKFDGQDITINPPKTLDLIMLGKYSANMSVTQDETKDEAAIDKAINDLTQQIYRCVPALEGKPLTLLQIQKLVEILSQMSMPPEAKELAKQNITVDTPKKDQTD